MEKHELNEYLKSKLIKEIDLQINEIGKIWESDLFDKKLFLSNIEKQQNKIISEFDEIPYIQYNFNEVLVKLNEDVNRILDVYDFDVIIGIPRGGTIVSTMISYICDSIINHKSLLNVPSNYPIKYDEDGIPELNLYENEINIIDGKKVILVDDGIFSGKTIKKYYYSLFPYCDEIKIYALNYNVIFSEIKPDFYGFETKALVKYPWKNNADPFLKLIDYSKFSNEEVNDFSIIVRTNTIKKEDIEKLYQLINNSYTEKDQWDIDEYNGESFSLYDEDYSYHFYRSSSNQLRIDIKRWSNIYETDHIYQKFEGKNSLLEFQLDHLNLFCRNLKKIINANSSEITIEDFTIIYDEI